MVKVASCSRPVARQSTVGSKIASKGEKYFQLVRYVNKAVLKQHLKIFQGGIFQAPPGLVLFNCAMCCRFEDT